MKKDSLWILGEGAGVEDEEEERQEIIGADGKRFLSDSGFTSPTEGSVVSEDDLFSPSSWLGGLGADFRNLAASLKETAGGVVGFVHRSAMSVATAAAEIAELEEDYTTTNEKDDYEGSPSPLRLPWEVMVDGSDGEYYKEDEELKRKIFLLSADEKTFLTPFSSRDDDTNHDESLFVLDEPRIQLIRHLLDIDGNLATTHARLSGRSHVRESLFWRNFFHHCEQARLSHMHHAVEAMKDSPSEKELPQLSRTKSDDDSSYVCVNTDIISPPTSLNWAGMMASSDGDLVVLDNLPSVEKPSSP